MVSPDWSGFNLFLAYQFDQYSEKLDWDQPADAEFFAETMFSGMASYMKNEFFVGASMMHALRGLATTSEPGDETNRGDSPMVFRLAGKYDAEKFGIAARYLNASDQMSEAAT